MCVRTCVCVCKLRVCRADKGLSILSGYKETLLLAENNRHLVATSATIIKTDNFSTRHNQVIASSYAEIPLINLVLILQLHRNEAVFGNSDGRRKVAETAEDKVRGGAASATLWILNFLQEKLSIFWETI